MSWTYSGNPGTVGATAQRDGVRWLVGDTDNSDQQMSDEEIAFALSQVSENIYAAGAIVCRAISAKYARLVDTSVDDTDVALSYSQRQDAYDKLASRLERQSGVAPSTMNRSLGIPAAGGISVADVRSAHEDDDRVKSVFQIDTPLQDVDYVPSE